MLPPYNRITATTETPRNSDIGEARSRLCAMQLRMRA